MEHYVGIDVSLKESSVCVVDSKGKIVRETKVASEPEALCRLVTEIGLPLTRIGLEAGPPSRWLREGLVDAGFQVVLPETRHVKAALSAMTVRHRTNRYLTDVFDKYFWRERDIFSLARVTAWPRAGTEMQACHDA